MKWYSHFAHFEKTKNYYHTKIFREIDVHHMHDLIHIISEMLISRNFIEKQEIIFFVKNFSWKQLFRKNRCFHEIFVKKMWDTVVLKNCLLKFFYICFDIAAVYQYLCSHLTPIEINWFMYQRRMIASKLLKKIKGENLFFVLLTNQFCNFSRRLI